jgi:hypothetical protein
VANHDSSSNNIRNRSLYRLHALLAERSKESVARLSEDTISFIVVFGGGVIAPAIILLLLNLSATVAVGSTLGAMSAAIVRYSRLLSQNRTKEQTLQQNRQVKIQEAGEPTQHSSHLEHSRPIEKTEHLGH